MSSREGGRGRGGAGLSAKSLFPTPVNTRPPRNHVAEPLPHCTNTTTLPQNTTQHANNHSTNNHKKRPTHNHTKNTIFKYIHILICYKFENHATYQCISTTPSCSECASHQQCNSPTKICLNCNQQHRTLAATCPYRKQGIHQKTKTKKSRDREKQPHIPRHSKNCHSTNEPTNTCAHTRIKLAALVIEPHIASLAQTESYGSILSKSLKRNFNIDTSFPDRDSQKIFNPFINDPDNKFDENHTHDVETRVTDITPRLQPHEARDITRLNSPQFPAITLQGLQQALRTFSQKAPRHENQDAPPETTTS
ncbi:hypothetical protein FHG87_000691 [Trinorchestia longiramus]|nr:hypothetical protein FHG87_000691 [Trinorchestia longiramus]